MCQFSGQSGLVCIAFSVFSGSESRSKYSLLYVCRVCSVCPLQIYLCGQVHGPTLIGTTSPSIVKHFVTLDITCMANVHRSNNLSVNLLLVFQTDVPTHQNYTDEWRIICFEGVAGLENVSWQFERFTFLLSSCLALSLIFSPPATQYSMLTQCWSCFCLLVYATMASLFCFPRCFFFFTLF